VKIYLRDLFFEFLIDSIASKLEVIGKYIDRLKADNGKNEKFDVFSYYNLLISLFL